MSQTSRKETPVRCLTEGGICVALSLALSYLKIPVMAGFGGFFRQGGCQEPGKHSPFLQSK